MGKFNLKDYATVEERLNEFREIYPDARVETQLEFFNDNRDVVIKASVYRTFDEQQSRCPVGVGIAEERQDTEMKKTRDGNEYATVNYTSHVENCDTSAVGRALANAGYSGKKGAPRPSREEMEKVERLGSKKSTPKKEVVTEPAGDNDPIVEEIQAFAESDKLVEWFTKTMNKQENPDQFKIKYLPLAQEKMDELG